MSQLVRDTGVSGARRRKKRVSDGWSFSSSVRASAACQAEIRICDERACGWAVGGWRKEAERGRKRKLTVWYVAGCVDLVEGKADLVFETPPTFALIRVNEAGKHANR